MNQPTYLILTALAAGRRHGYGVIGDVSVMTNGAVRLRAGTLYAALDRLVAAGLVAEDGTEVVDGRNRRYYRLTESGSSSLAAEARLMASRSQVALRRLAGVHA